MPDLLVSPSSPRFEAFLSALPLLQLVGVFAYAIAGAVAAKRRGLDVVGAISVAFVTAFGGGSLRDVLLGRAPVFWIRHPSDAAVVFIAATTAFYLVRVGAGESNGNGFRSRAVAFTDALGLGIFGATGAAYALQAGTSYLVAALLAVMTGVFGGVLRDVMLNEIPTVFRVRSELYATCVFLGSWVYLILHLQHLSEGAALLAGAGSIAGMRLLAVQYHWKLPHPAR